jgi:hypothetical protein
MLRDEPLPERLFLGSLAGLDALLNAERLVAGSRIIREFLPIMNANQISPDSTRPHPASLVIIGPLQSVLIRVRLF